MSALASRRAEQVDALLDPGDDAIEVIAGGARVLELVGELAGVRQQRAHDAAVRQREQLPPPAETLPIVEREPEEEPVVVPPDLRAGSDSVASSEEAKPEPRPAPPRSEVPAAPARQSDRDIEAKVLSAVLSSNMSLTRNQVAERAALTVEQISRPLTRLVNAGRLNATGATRARRYHAGDHKPHSAAAARTQAGRAAGEKQMTSAVARVGLRDRVMKAVSADPAVLDNRRLALALDATLEDVADACSWLGHQGPPPDGRERHLGVSIENRRFVGRADLLRATPAAVRFISAEPLLGPLVYDFPRAEFAMPNRGLRARSEFAGGGPSRGPELDLAGIDWLIVGGESGKGHRPIREEWVRDLRDAALATQSACPYCDHGLVNGARELAPCRAGCREGRAGGTAFFFKQWGGPTPKAGGRELDGRTWDELPSTTQDIEASRAPALAAVTTNDERSR